MGFTIIRAFFKWVLGGLHLPDNTKNFATVPQFETAMFMGVLLNDLGVHGEEYYCPKGTKISTSYLGSFINNYDPHGIQAHMDSEPLKDQWSSKKREE